MARSKRPPPKKPAVAQVTPVIHEAVLGKNGAVVKGAVISQRKQWYGVRLAGTW